MSTARICIVSSGCLSSGPRVEKEADALAAAGYAVHVLVCHTLPWMAEWDARLAASKRWSYDAVPWPPSRSDAALQRALAAGARKGTRALQLAAERVVATLGDVPLARELASSERLLPLLWRGRSLRADLFIAHNLAALPVAALLAERSAAKLAFDAEDDHVGEHTSTAALPPAARAIDAVQARYLPRCVHVTAAAEGIAEVLAERYGIATPTVVHNVFPWALRETLDGAVRDRRGDALSLYWYSQSLGLDRGLGDLIAAAGQLRGDFQLHLRGHATDEARDALLRLAREQGIESQLHLHPQVHPTELLNRSAEHDVGLALEQPVSRNRMLTVTNKLFFYMLAGLAVAATDTPGQRGVMRSVPNAGFLYTPGDSRALAQGLQRWLDERDALRAARAAALEAARTRWSWEHESTQLVQRVHASLASRAAPRAR